jgi:agmatine/peptidylarginine deiminase
MTAEAFVKRRIDTVPAQDIAFGGGAVHCITLEEPAPRP